MTLSNFLDICTNNKRVIYIILSKFYDYTYDLIEEIENNRDTIEAIKEYTICAFIPSFSPYVAASYLKSRISDAAVEHFYFRDEYMIVWIEEGSYE